MERPLLRILTALMLLCASLLPASAQDEVRIGIGFGLAFLPLYVCQDLKLIEKYGKEAHLDVKASFTRLMGAAQMRDALASGAVDVAPFGTAPLLAAWEQGKDTPQQIFAVAGVTTLPLTLLSNRPDEQSFADLKASDRIAVPTPTAPQLYVLELQSEKIFGRYDRLRAQVVALPHPDAVDALVEGGGAVTAYFASPPFTELASRDPRIHALLRSSDVFGGKSSLLIMAASKAYIERQPQLPAVIDQAIDEAARIIHDDPRRAAQIFLTHEPSGTINGAEMTAVLNDVRDDFGSAIHGVQAIADFMARHGELKAPPASWKEIVAPALLNSPSS